MSKRFCHPGNLSDHDPEPSSRLLSEPEPHNFHHLLFCASSWRLGEYAKNLRDHPYFRVYIPIKSLHNFLHHNITPPGIPVPPETICIQIFQDLITSDIQNNPVRLAYDSVFQRLNFLICRLNTTTNTDQTLSALKNQSRLIYHYYSVYGFPSDNESLNPYFAKKAASAYQAQNF